MRRDGAQQSVRDARDTIVPVAFHFPGSLAPCAQRVAVSGSFNAWNTESHRLTKTPQGEWTVTVFLPPGRVVYCFDVDGTPWLDPGDDGRIPNSWGSEYSVRNVRSAPRISALRHQRRRPGPAKPVSAQR